MKLILKILFVVVAILFPFFVVADGELPPLPAPILTPKDYISLYTALYGSNPDEVYSVGMCESKLTSPVIPGDSGHSFGTFAYFKETWERYSRKYNETFVSHETFDIYSIHDQIKLTSFVFSLGPAAKREWTTYVAIEKGGSYSFYSKINKRSYTIKCHLVHMTPETVY